MSDADLLRDHIERSGLSARAFAVSVMSRDERTIRRWLLGQITIPPVAAEWLRRLDSVRVRRDGSLRIIVRPGE